jgi:ATP-dependent Clp protease protease subunit
MTDTDSHELHPAEIERAQAEAEKFRAEGRAATLTARSAARKSIAEAEEIELKLGKLKHDADRENEKRRDELAGHRYHHVYMFKGSVDDSSAQKCMDQLTLWLRQDDEPTDIEILFNSPGGSVTAGLALWDHIQFIRSAGYKVTTSTIGMAASMAGILLQAGDVRIMGKESWLLIHEASFGAQGSFGEVEDTVKWIERIQGRILDIFATRSNLTKAQIKRRWTRTDWWISSDEALSLGLVDEVR